MLLGNMNRIAPSAESTLLPSSFIGLQVSGPQASVEIAPASSTRFATSSRTPHATFAPIHYEAGYAYPLIVWLHSTPGNEQQLRQVMPLVSMRNYVAVAPRGISVDRRQSGSYRWRQTSDDIEQAAASIEHCVDLAQRRYNIHAKRIFLVGFGSGGTMAVRVAWNDPHRFAGVATIGGPLPTQLCPLRRVNEMRRVPCLLAMARHSTDYPSQRVCNDLRLLHSAGCTVAVRQYSGGDGLSTHMLADLDRWLMELVCGKK
jgi:phospholipase/carboxylesterase